jgi:hypothetical protein
VNNRLSGLQTLEKRRYQLQARTPDANALAFFAIAPPFAPFVGQ